METSAFQKTPSAVFKMVASSRMANAVLVKKIAIVAALRLVAVPAVRVGTSVRIGVYVKISQLCIASWEVLAATKTVKFVFRRLESGLMKIGIFWAIYLAVAMMVRINPMFVMESTAVIVPGNSVATMAVNPRRMIVRITPKAETAFRVDIF